MCLYTARSGIRKCHKVTLMIYSIFSVLPLDSCMDIANKVVKSTLHIVIHNIVIFLQCTLTSLNSSQYGIYLLSHTVILLK